MLSASQGGPTMSSPRYKTWLGSAWRPLGYTTAGGRIDDPVHSRLVTRAENESVQQKVGSASGLMQIDVAAPAVVRRQVKNHAHAMHGALRHTRTPQIRFSELHAAALDVSPNVLELPAAQIINHSNSRPPFEQTFHQVGADK